MSGFGIGAALAIMAIAAYFNEKRFRKIEKKLKEEKIVDAEGEVIENDEAV